MNAILTLAAKDLRLLMRDRMALFFLFVFPAVYGIFFGSMFGGMGEKGSATLSVAIADEDQSDASRQFIKALADSGSVEVTPLPRGEAAESVRRGKQLAFIAIPKGFGESAGIFWKPGKPLDVGIDPARRAEAGFLEGLIMQASFEKMKDMFTNPASMRPHVERTRKEIAEADDMSATQRAVLGTFFAALDQFMSGMDSKEFGSGKGPSMEPVKINKVDVTAAKGERDQLLSKVRSQYEISFPSAMLWGVMGSLAGFAVSLVKERTGGTYFRLMAAPLARWQVVAGKSLACFACSMGVLAFMLVLGWMAFDVRVDNPLGLLAACASISFGFVGLMMLASVVGRSEQAVGGLSWAVLTVMAMIGGGMIPLVYMPPFMVRLSNLSPVKWSILALEGAIWRGFGVGEMLMPCAILLSIGAAGIAAGSWLLKRREG